MWLLGNRYSLNNGKVQKKSKQNPGIHWCDANFILETYIKKGIKSDFIMFINNSKGWHQVRDWWQKVCCPSSSRTFEFIPYEIWHIFNPRLVTICHIHMTVSTHDSSNTTNELRTRSCNGNAIYFSFTAFVATK